MEQEMRASIKNIVIITGITIAVYAGIRWLLPLVFPFFIGFFLAKLLNPLLERLGWRMKGRRARGILSTALVVFFSAAAIAASAAFVKILFDQAVNIAENFDGYRTQAVNLWNSCCGRIEAFTGMHSGTVQAGVQKYIPQLTEYIREDGIPSLVNGTVFCAKNILLAGGICFIAVISTVLVLKDYPKIRNRIETDPVGKRSLMVCRRTFEAGGAYIRSQLIIMLVIMGICIAGLYLSGNGFAVAAGVGIGVCDAMPFLGTGTILVPWALFKILQGKYMLAAAYAALYTVCTLTREILEPKLLGDKLGMHPLLVIVTIYIGLQVYGLWGFVLGPFSYILIREIFNCNFR